MEKSPKKSEQVSAPKEAEEEIIHRERVEAREGQKRVGELKIGLGDEIKFKTGAVYRVVDIGLDLNVPGGGIFELERITETEMSFQNFLDYLDDGEVEKIEHVEEEEK